MIRNWSVGDFNFYLYAMLSANIFRCDRRLQYNDLNMNSSGLGVVWFDSTKAIC